MATRILPAGALILGLAILVTGQASPAAAQYMVLTHPGAPPPAAETAPPAAPLPPPRPTARILDGELPNQRTGPKRERVVRDICIGCDR